MFRVMALHSVNYCERLFYLEEVEGLLRADHAVYDGRRLHEELKPEDVGESGVWAERHLSSELLGLTGKVDYLKRRDGCIVPYEHKRGRSDRSSDEPAAWRSDAVQVAAYAMLLEEDTGEKIAEGRIRYHTDNVTVRIPLDDSARKSVLESIEKARALSASLERPPIVENDRLCVKCSLAPVCLPEEERKVTDESHDTVRLFPPNIDKKTLHVTTPGARITRSAERLKVLSPDADTVELPIRDVAALVLHGYAQITTQAINLCAYNEIPVQWITAGGRFIAALTTSAGTVQRRLRQY